MTDTSTRTYEGRMARAEPWERDVLDALWLRGWMVEPIGQGQLHEPMRELLRDFRSHDGSETLVRWVPDICAAQRINGRVRAYLIDAKAGETWRRTDNHEVETSAVDAAEAIEPAWGIPVVFAFQDWSVASAKTIRDNAKSYRPGVGPGRTDFVIFPRSACTQFDRLFGTTDGD